MNHFRKTSSVFLIAIIGVSVVSQSFITGCTLNPLPPVIDDNFLNENSQPNDNADANENSAQNENGGQNENTQPNDNGIPGAACDAEGDCMLGTNCLGENCVATTAPDLVIGDESPFIRIVEGGDMIVRRGFQGGNHIFMSIQTAGFPITDVDGRQDVLFTRGVQPVGSQFALVFDSTVTQFLQDTGDGTGLLDRVFVFIDGILPANYDGQQAVVSITVTDAANPAISASIVQRVVLRAEQ